MFNEASYENSVIELFKNNLSYDYAYGHDIDIDLQKHESSRAKMRMFIKNY